MKKCNGCKKDKDESEFGKRWVRGKQYFRTQCKKCESKKRMGRVYSEEVVKQSVSKMQAKIKRMRAEGVDVDRWILQDSRRSDKKKGMSNDLDREFIRDAIRDGCSYCGETLIRMTLDRVDNNKGHLKDNVVPACIRCNYTRKSMPHDAWVVVAKGMTEAREEGLFGDWTGRAR